jgi:hypothetical protein
VNTWIFVNLEFKKDERWHSVIANEFYIPTDELLFDAIAGTGGKSPLFYPRGIPDSLSTYVHAHFFIEVVPSDADDLRKNLAHRWCYEPEAKQWIENFGAKVHLLGDRKFVSNPLSHHENYLSLREINMACEYSNYDLASAPTEFQLILEFMTTIDLKLGDSSSRAVIWFEN